MYDGVEILKNTALRVRGKMTIQIWDDLYTFSDEPLMISMFKGVTMMKENTKLKECWLASTDHNRYGYSLANYQDRVIYISGGWVENVTTSVLTFDIVTKTIGEAP